MSDFQSQLNTYVQAHTGTALEELKTLMRIPSISHMLAHAPDCQKVLEAMGEIVSQYGFTYEICHTDGLPCFIATLETDPALPWVMVYNHMDVQPAAEPQWVSEPFEPLVKDGRIYGRGSTDDKGPALTTLHAIHFLKSQGHALPNIQLVYETEEESGSEHFGQFLDRYKDKLHTPQSILVSDTIFEGDFPAITYRLKGLLEAEVELKSGTQDLHSGLFGGVAENPLSILIQALATCVNLQGQVTVPGVMDSVVEVSDAELEQIQRVAAHFDFDKLVADSGQAAFYSKEPVEILKRIWTQPTFEVHGFEGVQTQPDVIKTALPYHVKAKLTMRLVAGQDPKQVFEALSTHLKSFHPRIEVHNRGLLSGCMTDITHPIMEKAIAACEAGFGKAPLFVGSGGTIGALPEFQRVFPEAPIVLIAQSLMSDGYHAPNENFRISQIEAGMKTMAHYLHALVN